MNRSKSSSRSTGSNGPAVFQVSGIPGMSRWSAIGAPAQQRPDLVVIAKERNVKLGAAVLKDKSEIAIAAAFEELISQLADTKTAVNMMLTETIN